MKRLWPRRLSLRELRAGLAVLLGVFAVFPLFFLYPNRLPPRRDDLNIHHPSEKVSAHRCDTVFPTILDGCTLQLASVPDQYRIPPGTSNVTFYFSSSPRHIAPYREYFFDYNPSIIRIPNDQVPRKGAVYLASFRVSNLNYCFRPGTYVDTVCEQRSWNGRLTKPLFSAEDRQRMMNYTNVHTKDWLGLAMLTANLEIITDVVVDLRAVLRGAQDFRLFLLDTAGDSEQIYIGSNDVLVPLWLDLNDKKKTALTRIPSVFGDGFEAWVDPTILCAPCGKPRMCGKNFHFFTSQNQTWAEIWPTAPHLVRSVDSPCRRKNEPNQSFSTEHSPEPSFRNHEVMVLDSDVNTMHRKGKAPPWLTRGRGSACCIAIRHPRTGQSLWMGISHSKTLGNQGLQPNHYLSSIYAFESEPPFGLVAQSGYFCLPFPSTYPRDNTVMVNLTRWRVLRLGEDLVYPTCPRIHFVSGMTLNALDPTRVIISYGINDCVSRFVQVRLLDMLDVLFNGPS